MSRLARDGTAELVSRDQIIRRERGQGNIHFTRLIHSSTLLYVMTIEPYRYQDRGSFRCTKPEAKAHEEPGYNSVMLHLIEFGI